MSQGIRVPGVVLAALLILGGCTTAEPPVAAPEKPNFVVVFADDLGYGDLGTFGHPVFRTPNLDQLAAEGQKWTQFYVAANVCTPSRAALLTGRYPIRSGMTSSVRGVLFPDSGGGLPADEITIAEALADAGYISGAFGKWHLGHLPQYLPTRQGFATYWGIPYSNDMDKVPGSPDYRAEARANARWQADPADYNVPILHDEEEIERPADQYTITRRYTERAIEFIRANRDHPFFVYLAHSMVHIPLFASKDFDGRNASRYADAIEEVDWSVGQIVATLKELGLEERTLVVFTSDNGPWLVFDTHGGTAGPLRGGKGETWEGGQREPTVVWGPGIVSPGVVRGMGSTLDLLPTFCALAGVEPPSDRALDGYDLSPVLRGEGESPRNEMMYYQGVEIFAARVGPFKAHWTTFTNYRGENPVPRDPPLLFNLEEDPSEKYDVAARHPEVIDQIAEHVEAHKKTVEPVPDQLAIPLEP
ncbi:MAG: sulfatase [Acidobacteria bacterium]|jgi:arylsulfatase A-like enzyme|nr:sulfatase [Acidobacteriota bacterium]